MPMSRGSDGWEGLEGREGQDRLCPLAPSLTLCHSKDVIWLFDRGSERLKYEICRDDAGAGYLLIITAKDGQQHVERINQPTALIERSVDQMRQLRDDGWKIG